MEIKFGTKKQSKKAQETYFLGLGAQERFYHWLQLCYSLKKIFPPSKENGLDPNFKITIQAIQK